MIRGTKGMSEIKGNQVNYVSIFFNFKEKCSIEKILNALISESLENLTQTKIAIKEKTHVIIMQFKIKDNKEQFQNRYIKNICPEFRPFIKGIEIVIVQSELGSGLSFGTSINNFSVKEITLEELESIIKIFSLQLDKIDISVINRILLEGINESSEPLIKDFINRGLGVIASLLYNKSLTKADIENIIKILPKNDELFSSQILDLVSERSDFYSNETIERLFWNITGKKLKIKRKNYFKNALLQNKLESFFKNYIVNMRNILTDVIEYQMKHNPNKIKVSIPLNPENYKFDSLPKSVVKELKNCFYKYPYETLKTFKRVLYNLVESYFKKEVQIVVSYDYGAKDSELLENLAYSAWIDLRRNSKEMYSIIRGSFQKNDSFMAKPSWENDIEFYIKDKDGNGQKCIVNRNINYFIDVIESIKMNESIEIQGYLHENTKRVKGKTTFLNWEYYVIDIKVLKKFEGVEVDLGTNYMGKRKLHNTIKGVKLFVHRKKGGIIDELPVLDVPIILLNIYEGQNELFYEVELDGQTLCDTKMNIIDYIDKETALSYVKYADLKRYVGILFREYIKKKDLKPGFMFPAIGVFDIEKNGKKDLIVVYPEKENVKVFGENHLQTLLVDNIKNRGIDIDGDLAGDFYDLIHLESQPEWVRAIILGYSGINPFCYAIRSSLDIFPNLFILGVKGSGKTSMTKLLINEPFGTKLLNQDSIDSASRFTMYTTIGTAALNIDDLHEMGEKSMAFMKSNSTDKGTRDRNTVNQKMNREQTYACFCGSANENDWLKGKRNDAFRVRAFIVELTKRIDFKKQQILRNRQGELIKKGKKVQMFNIRKKFQQITNKITEGKLFGFHFLEMGLEFAETYIPDNKLTTYYKFVKILKANEEKITDLFISKNIDVDPRRLTMYSLLYTGWQIWNYVFELKNFHSNFLEKYLDLESEAFLNLINKLEGTEKSIMLEDIENMLYFFEYYYLDQSNDKNIYNGHLIITSKFISAYDIHARQRGYETFGTLRSLIEVQNDLLYKEDKPGNNRCICIKANQDDELDARGLFLGANKQQVWGVPFYYEEICALFNRLPRALNLGFQETLEKSNDIEKEVNVIKTLKEFFEANESETIERDSLIQACDALLENCNKDFIEKILEKLIQDKKVIERDSGLLLKS